MSQLNSQRESLACEWNFAIEGDPSPTGLTGLDLGLTINPGRLVEFAYYMIREPLVSPTPLVDTVDIFFFVNFLGLTGVLSDTVANINAKFLDTWYSGIKVGIDVTPNNIVTQNISGIAIPGNYQIRISTSNVMSGGRIATVWNTTCLDIK